jgi:Carboxypeptidase regulatory-like domain
MLKPVLHAGEVGLSSAVNGTVIDSSTGKPIVGGTTVVALEQKDGSGVDRVILSTLTDANGNFALCPVPTGSYDLVVIAMNGAGLLYAATVTTGVQASTAVGNIPVTPESNANGTITGPASLTGVVQTGGASGPVSEIITLSALQTVGINGSNVLVTIPLVQQSDATANVTTTNSASCPSGFDCTDFTLAVPGVNAFVGSFSGASTQYSQGAGAVSYNADGQPEPNADGTPVCGQTEVKSGTVTVTPGNTFPVGTLSFTTCT